MTHAASVIGGYVLTVGATVAYALWVVLRGRSVARSLGIGAQEESWQGPDDDAAPEE